MKTLPLLAISGMLAAPAAFAANTTQGLPAAITAGSAIYLSGGIGQDEAVAIQRVAKNYPLELEFVAKAKPHDEFTANVQVKITDDHGKTVIQTVSDGPFLLARLPAGRYRVEAIEDGHAKVREVAVRPGIHQRVVFEWAA